MALFRCWMALLAVAIAVVSSAAADRVRMAGRALADVLDDYEAAGYRFVYSSELVGDLRLEHEPGEGPPIGRLREGLLREGLTLRRGTGASAYRIVAVEDTGVEAVASPPRVLSGRIMDSATGLPLNGARVEIDGAVATTDADGRFAVEFRGSGTISASRKGYASRTLPVTAGLEAATPERGEVALELEPAIEEVARLFPVPEESAEGRHAVEMAHALFRRLQAACPHCRCAA